MLPDPATGIVWTPMYCTCDIPAGNVSRRKYRPVDGEGRGLPFNARVQRISGLSRV
jgi:hypothetical protein